MLYIPESTVPEVWKLLDNDSLGGGPQRVYPEVLIVPSTETISIHLHCVAGDLAGFVTEMASWFVAEKSAQRVAMYLLPGMRGLGGHFLVATAHKIEEPSLRASEEHAHQCGSQVATRMQADDSEAELVVFQLQRLPDAGEELSWLRAAFQSLCEMHWSPEVPGFGLRQMLRCHGLQFQIDFPRLLVEIVLHFKAADLQSVSIAQNACQVTHTGSEVHDKINRCLSMTKSTNLCHPGDLVLLLWLHPLQEHVLQLGMIQKCAWKAVLHRVRYLNIWW